MPPSAHVRPSRTGAPRPLLTAGVHGGTGSAIPARARGGSGSYSAGTGSRKRGPGPRPGARRGRAARGGRTARGEGHFSAGEPVGRPPTETPHTGASHRSFTTSPPTGPSQEPLTQTPHTDPSHGPLTPTQPRVQNVPHCLQSAASPPRGASVLGAVCGTSSCQCRGLCAVQARPLRAAVTPG